MNFPSPPPGAGGWQETSLGPADSEGIGPTGDNQINYSDIVRSNVVSQYQQMMTSQMPMTHQQAYKYLTNERFRFGTQEPDWRTYQRQTEMNRMAFGGAIATGMASYAGYGVTSAALAAAGITGIAGFGLSALLPALPVAMLVGGVQRSLERQRYMNQIASDVETYRGQLGMNNLTYNQATQLASNMTKNYGPGKPGNFFNAQQVADIHRMAIANNMISGKSKGMIEGDIKAYEKNFSDLLKMTERVVKTLNTTVSGGMSLMKEMRQQGFGTFEQIGQAITTAKAYGTMTGLGVQNMLQIGAAGAAAVQGTSWSGVAGTQMYQYGAAQAGWLARGGDITAQRSVQMAGGVAQAGATIAGAQMNMMKSGIGRRVTAYLMGSKGELDQTNLNRLLTGEASAYEITRTGSVRAADLGYRVMFNRRSGELLNKVAEEAPEAIDMISRQAFNIWRRNRRGTFDQQAQWYAESQSGGDQDRANLIADMLTRPTGYGTMRAERITSLAIANKTGEPPGPFRRWERGVMYDIQKPFNELGAGVVTEVSATGEMPSRVWSAFARGTATVANAWVRGAFNYKYDYFNTSIRGPGDLEKAYRNMYSLGKGMTQEDMAFYKQNIQTARGMIEKIPPAFTNKLTEAWGANIIKGAESIDLQHTVQILQSGLFSGRMNEAFNQGIVQRTLHLDRGNDDWKKMQSDPTGYARAAIIGLQKGQKSISKAADDDLASWAKYSNDNKNRLGDLNMAILRVNELNETQRRDLASKDINKTTSQSQKDMIMAVKKRFAEEGSNKVLGIGTITSVNNYVDLAKFEGVAKAGALSIIRADQAQQALAGGPSAKGFVNYLSGKIADVFLRKGAEQLGYTATVEGMTALRTKLISTAGLSTREQEQLNVWTSGEKEALLNKLNTYLDPKGAGGQFRLAKEKAVTAGIANQFTLEMAQQTVGKKAKAGTAEQLLKETQDYITGGLEGPVSKNVAGMLAKNYGYDANYWYTKSRDKTYNMQTLVTNLSVARNAVSDLDRANQNIVALNNMANNPKTIPFVMINDGTTVGGKKVTKGELDANLKEQNEQRARLTQNAQILSERETAQGKTINAQVNPPVLNYFNNSWSL